MWPTFLSLCLALSRTAPRKARSRRRPAFRRPTPGCQFCRPGIEWLESRLVPAPLNTPVTAGLVSSYSFDSGIVDDVGLNNPSAFSNATLVPSKVGNGLTLAPGGYVDIADNGSLDNQAFTVSAWVRPEGPSTNGDGEIVAKNDSESQSSLEFAWSAATGHFKLFCNSTPLSSQDAFAPGPFYQVAATYDGTTLELFVNGVLEGQQTGVGTVPYSPSQPWTIGSEGPLVRPGLSRTFNGVIDEVYFYNRALSATEIQSIVAAAPANAPPSAKAGGPYVLAAGSSVTLDASASSDPDNDPLTYSWTINGHAGAATGVNPILSWSALQALGVSTDQSYSISVTVDDGQGHAVSSASAVLWAAPQLPVLPVTAGLVSSYSFDSGIVDDVGLNTPPPRGSAAPPWCRAR
jgi:concanavalin A-like lectin/glucanase superfamily protein/PKD domain-containing protein